MVSPTGSWQLSAPRVTVSGFTGEPVPVAEHFTYFKQECTACARMISEQRKAWETFILHPR